MQVNRKNVVAIFIVLLLAGIFFLTFSESDNSVVQALQSRIKQLPLVSALDVEQVEGIAFGNGRIEAVQVDVTTKIAGRVESIFVKEGDLVKGGQRIATMGYGPGKVPMLHFEIRRDGKPVKPLDYLKKQ